MFDAHVHLGAQGEYAAAEVAALARQLGYRSIGLLARCDQHALATVLPPLVRACRSLALFGDGEALPGVELVHIPPPLMAESIAAARAAGAGMVAVHGEFPGGCVPCGTTLAAIEAGADLVLHPGSLTIEEATCAARRGVYLELSLCPRHGLFNGHVARLAEQAGASLLAGSNARQPHDMLPLPGRRAVLRGAGLNEAQADRVDADSLRYLSSRLR